MFEARWSAYTIETKDGRTLMPSCLEAAISKEQMSDLIAFLHEKHASRREVL